MEATVDEDADARRYLMDMRSQEKSDASYVKKIWALRNQEQDDHNRERRARYGMPHANLKKWKPKPWGAQQPSPPLTAVTDEKVTPMRKKRT
jgi:hypothetical protein